MILIKLSDFLIFLGVIIMNQDTQAEKNSIVNTDTSEICDDLLERADFHHEEKYLDFTIHRVALKFLLLLMCVFCTVFAIGAVVLVFYLGDKYLD